MSNTKICRTCGKEKLISEYTIDKRWRGTVKLDCKPCHNAKKKLRYNPIQNRETNLKRNYDITYKTVCSMYTQQNGCCAICGKDISLEVSNTKKKKAHVDHCHQTGKVRGLLCTKCNTLLGMAEDNKDTLQNAILYLDRSQDD